MHKEEDRKYKQVTREEFLVFLDSYPNPLNWDLAGICDPPVGSYNDFSDGKKWPESIVAKISLDWMGPNGETDNGRPGKFWVYYILE